MAWITALRDRIKRANSDFPRKNNAGRVSEDSLAGRNTRDEFSLSRRLYNSYLLMESLLIEPLLSILTLMMWIEFLSAYT